MRNVFYKVPNPSYNTEQLFNITKASMIMYDYKEETLTIQYDYACEYEIKKVSEEEYRLIKNILCYSYASHCIKHEDNML